MGVMKSMLTGARQGVLVSYLDTSGALCHGELLAIVGAQPYLEAVVAEGDRVVYVPSRWICSLQHNSRSKGNALAMDSWYGMYHTMRVYSREEVWQAAYPDLNATQVKAGNARYATHSQQRRWLAKQVEKLHQLLAKGMNEEQAHWFGMLLFMETQLSKYGHVDRVAHRDATYPLSLLLDGAGLRILATVSTGDPDFPAAHTYQVTSLKRCRALMDRVQVSSERKTATQFNWTMLKHTMPADHVWMWVTAPSEWEFRDTPDGVGVMPVRHVDSSI